MTWTLAEIGVALLAFFAVCHYLKIFATLRAVAAFAGVCLIGANTALGLHFIRTAAQSVQGWASDLTFWLFGVRFGPVLFIILAAVLLYDLHRKHPATARTGIIAVAVAFLLIGGVSGLPLVNGIPGGVRTGVSNVRAGFGG